MQIPFNQVELSPLLYQIYVLFVQCVAVSAYLSGITVTKKKGIELRIFYYVNFWPGPNMIELFFYLIKQL